MGAQSGGASMGTYPKDLTKKGGEGLNYMSRVNQRRTHQSGGNSTIGVCGK